VYLFDINKKISASGGIEIAFLTHTKSKKEEL